MHLFSIREPGMVRAFANLELPTNPICWLFGHRAIVTVVEGRYTEPWRLVRCRICDLRYTGRSEVDAVLKSSQLSRVAREEGPLTAQRIHEIEKAVAEELRAGQVDFARRDPKAVAKSCSGRDGYGHRTLELGAELHWRRPSRKLLSRLGVRLHTGGRGSETPFDAHLDLGLIAGYFKIGGIGGRWAEFIGRGHGRDLSLAIHGGQLWWKVWHDDDGGNDRTAHRCDKWRTPPWPWSLGRRKYRGWLCLRDGNIELNPVTAIVGDRPHYHRDESGQWREAFVDVGQFPGDRYLVSFRAEPWELHRDHGPAWARRVLATGVSYDWDAGPGGIPIRNHEWKGDEVIAGSVSATVPAGEDWLPHAAAALADDIRRDRVHHGYRPPEQPRLTLVDGGTS